MADDKSGDPTSTPDHRLSDEDRRVLLRLARDTVTSFLNHDAVPELPSGPALQALGAVFVTFRDRATGALRGCRGEVEARRPLAEAVMRTAIASATADPRFPPVTADELPGLHLEISRLTPMLPIKPDEIEVGRHGLMLRAGPFVGLLLPQVPVSQGWDRGAYLSGLCMKAGLPDRSWERDDIELLAFEAEVWEEGPGPGDAEQAGPGPHASPGGGPRDELHE